jgi:Ca2+-binding EF-hand superfamily protein
VCVCAAAAAALFRSLLTHLISLMFQPPSRKKTNANKRRKTADVWADIPEEIRTKIVDCIDTIMQLSDDSDDDAMTATRTNTIQTIFSNQLALPHVRTTDIAACFVGQSQSQQHEALQHLAANMYRQTVRCQQVFGLLDTADKGCIVVEDLYRVAAELFTNGDDQAVSQQEVDEMMEEFATCSNGGGTATLSRDDLIRIARLVNL